MNLKDKKTDHFCILPWVHFQLHQNGDLLPCCQSVTNFKLGNIRETAFDSIWNGQPIREMRVALKKDQHLESCTRCYDQEKRGGVSLRQSVNTLFRDHFDRVDRTSKEGILEDLPTYLGLRFSNICNFRCRTCSGEYSTQWHHESQILSKVVSPKKSIIRPTHTKKELWELLNRLLPNVTHIYFAGGEPLLEESHYQLLENLLEMKKTNVFLTYNTNFSTLRLKKWNAISLWKQFKYVNISASLDGVGEAGELIRKGLRNSEIEKNFVLLSTFTPHVKFYISPTISVMNAFHITQAIDHWLDRKMIRFPNQLRVNILKEPSHLSLNILSKDEKNNLIQNYQRSLRKWKAQLQGGLFRSLEAELHSILASFSQDTWWKERTKFVHYTNELDQLREEKFLKFYPELSSVFDS